MFLIFRQEKEDEVMNGRLGVHGLRFTTFLGAQQVETQWRQPAIWLFPLMLSFEGWRLSRPVAKRRSQERLSAMRRYSPSRERAAPGGYPAAQQADLRARRNGGAVKRRRSRVTSLPHQPCIPTPKNDPPNIIMNNAITPIHKPIPPIIESPFVTWRDSSVVRFTRRRRANLGAMSRAAEGETPRSRLHPPTRVRSGRVPAAMVLQQISPVVRSLLKLPPCFVVAVDQRAFAGSRELGHKVPEQEGLIE